MRKLHGRDEYQDLLLARYKVSVSPESPPGVYISQTWPPQGLGGSASTSHTALPFPDKVNP
jgi:hypothetical protein